MTYPVINLKNANEMLKPVGIQITKHPLGYYEAMVSGKTHSNQKLGVLVTELMTTYFKLPDRPSIHLIDTTQDQGDAALEQFCARRRIEAGLF